MPSYGRKRTTRHDERRKRRKRHRRRAEAKRLECHTRLVSFEKSVEWVKYDSNCDTCMEIEGGYDRIKDVPIPEYDRLIYVKNNDNDGGCLARVYFKHGKTEKEIELYRKEREGDSYPRGNPSRADK